MCFTYAIYHVLQSICKMTTAAVQSVDKLTQELFSALDVNKDDKISYEEFLEGASKNDFVINLLQPDPEPDS